MKIPETIYIGAIPIKIEKSSMAHISGAMGRAIESQQLIMINTDMTSEMQEKIFFHELIHIILDILGLHDNVKNSENFIDCISLVLHQAMKQIET